MLGQTGDTWNSVGITEGHWGVLWMTLGGIGMSSGVLGGPGGALGLYLSVLGMKWAALGETGGIELASLASVHHCPQPVRAGDQGLGAVPCVGAIFSFCV